MRRYRVPPGYGQWLRYFREQASLTQVELSERSGVAYPTISYLENDKVLPSKRVRVLLARTLGVTPQELFPATTAPTPPEVLRRHIRRREARERRAVA